jgi:4-hydroxy-tetrahydrodipicolinate synthase
MYVRLTQLAGDKILVSTASEDEWFDNIVELGWRLYLCSSPPYTLQTGADRRMREYTDLAFRGETARAKAVRDSLNPVREAFRRTRPPEKFHAHSKYWLELLGLRVEARQRALLGGLRDSRSCQPDDCTRSTSRNGSARTSICSSRRSATRRCSRTAR